MHHTQKKKERVVLSQFMRFFTHTLTFVYVLLTRGVRVVKRSSIHTMNSSLYSIHGVMVGLGGKLIWIGLS